MEGPASPDPWRRVLGAPLAVVVFLALGVAAHAAGPPRPANPHGRLKEPCSLCHGAAGYKPAEISPKFDHTRSGFPLTGTHGSVSCRACHGSLQFAQTPSQCISCHEKQYQLASQPDHPLAGFAASACSSCHTTTSWFDGRFDHQAVFPLAGAHATARCTNCHLNDVYKGTPGQCASCHSDPHLAELGTDCGRCHSARTFNDRGPMLNAHRLTRLPLTGVHASIDCEDCHRPGPQGRMQFVGTQAACQSCHLQQYQAARGPDHAAAGYPLQCDWCHGEADWARSRFDHDASGFPLAGAHRAVPCSGCHGNGVFKGRPTSCQGCHETQYLAATPDHARAGFTASQCASCHTTAAWTHGRFDHNETAFALTGAHAAAACNDCHQENVFKGRARNCLSCHQEAFSLQSRPRHNPTDFPDARCGECHTTSSWSGGGIASHANFYPTDHHGTDCADCHADKSDYMDNSCSTVICHRRSGISATHAGRAGYSASAPDVQCVNPGCHARGSSGG